MNWPTWQWPCQILSAIQKQIMYPKMTLMILGNSLFNCSTPASSVRVLPRFLQYTTAELVAISQRVFLMKTETLLRSTTHYSTITTGS